MKKLKISLLIIAIVVFTLNIKSLAVSLQAKIDITPDKTEAKAGEYVTFNIKIKDIANADGGSVSAIGGVITYNTNFFETINQDDCTAIVNTTTGSFNLTFIASADKDVGTIKLKVKSNPTGEGTVSFTKLTASDGEEETEETTKNLTIGLVNESGQTSNETTGGNTTYENSTFGGNTTGENSTSEGNTTSGNSTTEGNTTAGENVASGNSVSGGNTSSGENANQGNNTKSVNNTSNNGTQNNIMLISGNSTNSATGKTDTTIADKIIPKTGIGTRIIAGICILGIISLVTYKKYKYYNSIK